MDNIYIRGPTSLVIRQVKESHKKTHLTLNLNGKVLNIIKSNTDEEIQGLSHTIGETINWYDHFGKQLGII